MEENNKPERKSGFENGKIAGSGNGFKPRQPGSGPNSANKTKSMNNGNGRNNGNAGNYNGGNNRNGENSRNGNSRNARGNRNGSNHNGSNRGNSSGSGRGNSSGNGNNSGNRNGGSRRRNMNKTPYVRVLDYLPQGKNAIGRRNENSPLIQGIDENTLALLEIDPLENVIPEIGSSVAPDSETAGRFRRRISYEDLSRGAELELPVVLDKIIEEQETKFIRFFNEPVGNNKFNSLRLLSGIGDKIMWAIIEEGEKQPFSGFDDLCERIPTLTDPKEKIRERIIKELSNFDKYHFFVIGPKKEE